jgi:hypothetical protein
MQPFSNRSAFYIFLHGASVLFFGQILLAASRMLMLWFSHSWHLLALMPPARLAILQRHDQAGRAFYFSGRVRGRHRVAPIALLIFTLSKRKPPRFQVEKPRRGHLELKRFPDFNPPANGFDTVDS